MPDELSRCRLCGGPSDRVADYDVRMLGGYWAELDVPIPNVEIRRCGRFGSFFTSVIPPDDLVRGQYLVDWDEYYSDVGRSPERKLRRCLSQLARFVPAGARILDVGGGNGAFALAAANDYECWLQELNTIRPIRFRRAGVTTVASVDEVPAGSFHAITLWDVFEHVWPHDRFLDPIEQALAPDGLLLLEVPTPTRLTPLFIALGRLSGTPRRERSFAQVCDFSHLQLMTPAELVFELRTLGFEVINRESLSELSYDGHVYARRLIPSESLAGLVGRAFDHRLLREVVLGANKTFLVARRVAA